MKYFTSSFLLVLFFLMVSSTNALTIPIETTTGSTTSTSTVTIPDPVRTVQSLEARIAELLQQVSNANLQGVVYIDTEYQQDNTNLYDNLFAGARESNVPQPQNTSIVVEPALDSTPSGQNFTAVGRVSACEKFSTNYSLGAVADNVMQIQIFLNKDSDIRVAESGAGSIGNETTRFGSLTLAAVKKFQEKYRVEILESIGLTEATGYWGNSTRKMAHKLQGCAT